jgi:nitroreductase
LFDDKDKQKEKVRVPMTVENALQHRKSCRAFLERSVDGKLLRAIIEQASRAPSNGNLQPWQLFVLTGDALASLKATTRDAVAQNQPMSTPEYAVYPKPLKTEFDTRRFAIGEDIYRVLGIAREDKAGRRAQFAKNALMFNAPVGVFAYIDRSLSYGQWMDLGMFLQGLMLLCEDHGLASCAQGYWTFFHDNVRAVTGAPNDLMLACGLAIGFEDTEAPINRVHSARVSIDEFATFID